MLHAGHLIGKSRRGLCVLRERCFPGGSQLVSALADSGSKMLTDAIGNKEFCIFRPAINALGAANFFLTQRLAVGFLGVLLIGRAIGDVAVNDNERRTVLRLLK